MWSAPGKEAGLTIEGATYRRMEYVVEDDGELTSRLEPLVRPLLEEWGRQAHPVSVDTYQHLARVLQNSGLPSLAKDVLATGHEHRRRHWSRWERAVGLLFKVTMDYGYRPGRLLAWAVGLAAVGSVLFWLAQHWNVVTTAPAVAGLVGGVALGFGALLPLSTLEPIDGTSAHDGPWLGLLYNAAWAWYWFENVAGWFLAAIGVAGLANVVRRV